MKSDVEQTPLPRVFDLDKLKKLFDFGYEAASSGHSWLKHPSDLGPRERC